jgi:hypothetical protein
MEMQLGSHRSMGRLHVVATCASWQRLSGDPWLLATSSSLWRRRGLSVHACDGRDWGATRREVEDSTVPMDLGSLCIVADGCAHWIVECPKVKPFPLRTEQAGPSADQNQSRAICGIHMWVQARLLETAL